MAKPFWVKNAREKVQTDMTNNLFHALFYGLGLGLVCRVHFRLAGFTLEFVY